MPHATRPSGRSTRHVKRESGHQSTANSESNDSQPQDQGENNDQSQDRGDNDGQSTTIPIGQSFYHGRSDAPPPSDRLCTAESDVPLFREVRPKTRPVTIGSPGAADESFNFHTSFQDMGKKMKACNDTLGELQGLGVSHDVPLPELVLVGDQSAGKSSVMSGLANLELPRSEGTCTRCPLHIRVSHNTDWSCRVSLSKEYSYKPPGDRPITDTDVTEEDPFFPWRRLPNPQIYEFKTVHETSEIEDVLRWAQIAILNDQQHHQLFIPGSGATALNTEPDIAAEQTTAKFSPNVVSLEIKGPDLPNLSFYDMPGIFQNPADVRDEYLVNVVRNLSISYIKRPSAIIMCSMPMNSDAENSFSFGLCRKLGASNRTIGVLTKADLLPDGGNHDQWLSIMRGDAHTTGLGYFITSRPQGRQLDELMDWEINMFERHSSEKWPAAFHPFVHRCGVEKLKSFLSERLAEEFGKSLPHIERKVKLHLDKINRQLSSLPELPDNVELEVQRSLYKFNEAARNTIDEFTKNLNRLSCHFRDCLLHIKPKFVLKDYSDHPVLEISDDDSDAEPTLTNHTTPSKRRNMAPPVTPAKRRRGATPSVNGSNVKPEDSDGSQTTPVRVRNQPPLPAPFTQFSKIGSGFRTLRQVREEIERKTKAGMPTLISEEVYQDLALEAVAPWHGPLETYLKEAMTDLHKQLITALANSFNALKKRIVFREAKTHLANFVRTHHYNSHQEFLRMHQKEKCRLVTFNDKAFERYKDEESKVLVRFRHKMRMVTRGLTPARTLEEPWDTMSEAKKRDEDKHRADDIAKIGRDQFGREVEVVAYIRGYYRLAALRFSENVSQGVLCQLIPDIKDELSIYLNREMGLLPGAAREVYERLMEEDPDVASKRDMLKREKEKFVKALASIEALNAGGADADENNGLFAHSEVMVDDNATVADVGV